MTRKRWLQFSLRRLLIAVTLVAIVVAMVIRPAYVQQLALRKVDALGWGVYVEPRYTTRRASGKEEYLNKREKSNSFTFNLRQQVVGIFINVDPLPPATGSLPSLESLNVLAKFPHLRSLTVYFPTPSGSRAAGYTHLSDLPQLNSLERLDIGSGDLQDDDVERIVSRIPNVRHLSLRSSDRLTNRSVRSIARLTQLESLALAGAAIDDGAADDLKLLTNLAEVDLNGTKIGDQVARALATLPRLTQLWITTTQITATGFEAIAKAGTLERLLIGPSTLDNDQLAMLQNLVKLNRLDLYNLVPREARMHLNDDGARHLAAVPNLKVVSIQTGEAADLPNLAPILNQAGIDFHISLPHGKGSEFKAAPGGP
jgi:hypothetical protein